MNYEETKDLVSFAVSWYEVQYKKNTEVYVRSFSCSTVQGILLPDE